MSEDAIGLGKLERPLTNGGKVPVQWACEGKVGNLALGGQRPASLPFSKNFHARSGAELRWWRGRGLVCDLGCDGSEEP